MIYLIIYGIGFLITPYLLGKSQEVDLDFDNENYFSGFFFAVVLWPLFWVFYFCVYTFELSRKRKDKKERGEL